MAGKTWQQEHEAAAYIATSGRIRERWTQGLDFCFLFSVISQPKRKMLLIFRVGLPTSVSTI